MNLNRNPAETGQWPLRRSLKEWPDFSLILIQVKGKSPKSVVLVKEQSIILSVAKTLRPELVNKYRTTTRIRSEELKQTLETFTDYRRKKFSFSTTRLTLYVIHNKMAAENFLI